MTDLIATLVPGQRIRVRVNAMRRLAGIDLPLLHHGRAGAVLWQDGGIVVVKLDEVSARELRFRVDELESL